MNVKTVLLRGLLGIPIGIAISITIALCISLSYGELSLVPPQMIEHFGCELSAFTNQYILSCIIGFVSAASSCIFEIEKWSMAKQTFIHFLVITIVFFPISIFAGWIGTSALSLFIYCAIFIAIYIGIWTGLYLYWKNKIKYLNKSLNNSTK